MRGAADLLTGSPTRSLKQELQRKLHLARRLRRKDMVERRRTDVAVGQPEIRAVQEVKQLRAELELFQFGQLEILKRCEIPVCISWTEIDVAALGAKLAGVSCEIEPLESAGVEPGANRARPGVRDAVKIGPLRGESSDFRR